MCTPSLHKGRPRGVATSQIDKSSCLACTTFVTLCASCLLHWTGPHPHQWCCTTLCQELRMTRTAACKVDWSTAKERSRKSREETSQTHASCNGSSMVTCGRRCKDINPFEESPGINVCKKSATTTWPWDTETKVESSD